MCIYIKKKHTNNIYTRSANNVVYVRAMERTYGPAARKARRCGGCGRRDEDIIWDG